jgi:3-hydroxyisobutyrate dehydrogenase
MTTNQTPTIGFVGLGAMGLGMARSLRRAGFPVQGFDLSSKALAALEEAGGTACQSAAEAATGADIFVVMVVNSDQAETVLFGSGQAAQALPKGSVVILGSTVKPEYARTTAQRLYDLGLEMLDSPVSGGTARAASGELSMMISGHPQAFAKADGVLKAMAAHVYRLGDECGPGSTVKMINQLLAGVHIAAAAEAMAFGVKAGVDPQTLYEVISNSAGSSWMFQNRVPHMVAGDYTPLSAVEIFVKDLGIVLETGKAERFPLFLAAAAHQLFLAAAAAGFGREDDAAVVKVFEQLAGIQVAADKQK